MYILIVYWEERKKSHMHFLKIYSRGGGPVTTMDSMVLEEIDIIKSFQT